MSAAPMAFAVADRRAVRTTLLQLLRPHRTLALLAAVLFAGTAAAGLLTPLLLGVIVDRVLTGEPPGAVTALAVAIAVAGVVQAVLATAAPAAAAHATEPALAELREAVVTRSLQLPIEVVERIGTGDLVARTDGDVEAVTEAVDRVLPEMLLAGLTVVVSVIGITALDWRLGLAALTAVPLQAHTLRWYLPRSSPLYTAERVAAGERAAQLLETVSGRDTVRALGMAEHHHELVRHRSRTAADLVVAATRLRTRFFARLNLAEVVGLASILATGFVLVDRGQVSVGAVTAAALLFQRLFDPINVLLFLVDDAQSAGAALARLVGVTELPSTPTPTQASDADAKVSVLDVSHAYRTGHDVLHSIDLHVVAGETVAIVGTTGAGKSTLAALVAGLRSPDRGEVRVADLPVADLTAVGGRPPVALITQEIHVFAGSLADDLRLVAPDADDDALRTALDRVGAASWVDALPDGMDTVVGEGGHQLTATQAQHLALVRLHLVDPAVGVLDEATAETGSAGARVLEQASAAALAGRTAVVVAHRLSQAARADRIVVLDHGKIAEAGTHDELLRAGGTYAALWAAWSSSGRTDAAQRTSG